MLKNINQALLRINNHSINTPLEFSERLSNKYNCEVFLKREDLQKTRSFKIRGSLNNILKNYNQLGPISVDGWCGPPPRGDVRSLTCSSSSWSGLSA